RINRDAVPPVAALAERIAVIGRENDDAVVVETHRAQIREELAEAAIDAVDLRRIQREETWVVLAFGHGAVLAVRGGEVLRQREREHRLAVGPLVEALAQLRPRAADIELHDAAVAIELHQIRMRPKQRPDMRVHAHVPAVAVGVEQLLERVAALEVWPV